MKNDNFKEIDTVALYIRVSTVRQAEDGYSLEAQEHTLMEEAKKHGKTVYKVYCDAGLSGSRADRPGLLKLLKDAKMGLFGSVWVWKLNRISRNLSHLLDILDSLRTYGVDFHSLSEQFDLATPMGKFTVQILGGIAQMQRETWRENSLLGSKSRAKHGKYCGGQILGYRLVLDEEDTKLTNKLIVDEKEAESVKLIYELYLSGKGLKAVTNAVNMAGYRSKAGRLFSVVTIRKILTNPAYTGKVKYGGEYYYGLHEPIIPDARWEKVQEILSRKKTPVKCVDYGYLLSGIIRCPVCGSWMVPYHVYRKTKTNGVRKYYYYVCGRYNSQGKVGCKANLVRAVDADNAVLGALAGYLNQGQWVRRVLTVLGGEANGESTEKVSRPKLLADIKNLRAKMSKLLSAYEGGILGKEDFLTQCQTVKIQIKDIQARMDAHNGKKVTVEPKYTENDVKRAFLHLKDLLDAADVKSKKSLVRSLVRSVYVDNARKVSKLMVRTGIPGQEESLMLQIS